MAGNIACYSSNCRFNPYNLIKQYKCYNPNCPRKIYDFNTTQPCKAYKGGIRTESKPAPTKALLLRKNVRGEGLFILKFNDDYGFLGLPFPFPNPYEFKSKSSQKRSLLILPRAISKCIARQGGTNPNQ